MTNLEIFTNGRNVVVQQLLNSFFFVLNERRGHVRSGGFLSSLPGSLLVPDGTTVQHPSFYPAEDYHQDYFANHPEQGYCAFVVAPKVQKFLKTFVDRVAHA